MILEYKPNLKYHSNVPIDEYFYEITDNTEIRNTKNT